MCSSLDTAHMLLSHRIDDIIVIIHGQHSTLNNLPLIKDGWDLWNLLTFNLYLVSLERKHFIQFLVDATFCKLLRIAHKLQKQEKVKFLKVLD